VSKHLTEREKTRRPELAQNLAWKNAPAVQQAGGDAAALARGLRADPQPAEEAH